MRVVSYNILAPCYAKPDRYPYTDRSLLSWEARRDRLIQRIQAFDADLLCLQEVEACIYAFLQRRLESLGYSGLYAQKGQNRPDGCATFYRADRLSLLHSNIVYFNDCAGGPVSGHLALVARFDLNGRAFNVANTHIRWDEPDASGEDHCGYRQVRQLVDEIVPAAPHPWILCGDFNVTPDTDVVRVILSHGFIDAYAGAPQPTANSECRQKRIDYIFHSPAFRSEPMELPAVDDETPLPSEIEPSDHLPISAEIW